MKKYVSDHRRGLLTVVLLAASALGIVLYTRKDNLNRSQLQQVAYAHIVKDCLKVAKHEMPDIDCSYLEVDQPELQYINIGGLDGWSTGASLNRADGMPVVWSIDLNARGKVQVLNLSR